MKGVDSATYGVDKVCRLLNLRVYCHRGATDEEMALLSCGRGPGLLGLVFGQTGAVSWLLVRLSSLGNAKIHSVSSVRVIYCSD